MTDVPALRFVRQVVGRPSPVDKSGRFEFLAHEMAHKTACAAFYPWQTGLCGISLGSVLK